MKVRLAVVLEECITRGVTNALLNVDEVQFEYEQIDQIVDNFLTRIMREVEEYFIFED